MWYEKLVEAMISGLRVGSVYALIALGYTMVYGILKLINFAHGEFIMIGAFVSLWVSLAIGATWFTMIICANCFYGCMCDRCRHDRKGCI